ncbi:pentatricopeptide repeat-containing protein [Sesbania bispinosa]|nr:pentatricopeptide repeat-containing protein [Sesbania bispinosa]
MASVSDRVDILEQKVGGIRTIVENLDERMARLKDRMGKHIDEAYGSSNHREEGLVGNGSNSDYHHSMDVKMVELTAFNGDDQVGWITRA